MPFKHNATRRHRIPKLCYRVRSWPAYQIGLKRRDDLMLWLDEDALTRRQALRRSTPGGQARYSDAAIELVLMLWLVFHFALGQAEFFATNVVAAACTDAARSGPHDLEPAHSQPRQAATQDGPARPLHLVIDKTGLKLFGQDDWDAEEDG